MERSDEGVGVVECFIRAGQPPFPESGELAAGHVEGLSAVPKIGQQGVFVSLGEAGTEGCFGFGADQAVSCQAGSAVVEGALKDFQRVFTAGIEVVVAQVEFRGGMGVTANPVPDGAGVLPYIFQAGVPGLLSVAGVEQGFNLPEGGRFYAVADAAYFVISAFVRSGEAADAEGGGAGGPVILKTEDAGGHVFFLSVHCYEWEELKFEV